MLKRACTEDQIKERKREIIQITNKMFDEMDYHNISMKTISEKISIARSSLYCYYTNKEEIMLDILQIKYTKWIKELSEFFSINHLSNSEIALGITNIYLKNIRLLKIISIYLTEIEIHCSLEKLVKFKTSFVQLFSQLRTNIKKTFNSSNDKNINNLFNSLLMLTHSLYPMICPNENQYKAMKAVGMQTNDDKHEYCYNYLLFILANM